MSEKDSLKANPDPENSAAGVSKPGPSSSLASGSQSPPASPPAYGTGEGGAAPGKSKPSVQIREPPVSATRGYTVVKIEEKHGPLYNAIPVMPLPLAIIMCILNILLPGTGTLLSSPAVFCCGPMRMKSAVRAFGLDLLSALLQMLTFIVIVGWIWSILWGMTFVQLSLAARKSGRRGSLPYYVRRQSSVESRAT